VVGDEPLVVGAEPLVVGAEPLVVGAEPLVVGDEPLEVGGSWLGPPNNDSAYIYIYNMKKYLIWRKKNPKFDLSQLSQIKKCFFPNYQSDHGYLDNYGSYEQNEFFNPIFSFVPW
jgi:hypothetical protein